MANSNPPPAAAGKLKAFPKSKPYFIRHWPVYSMILPGLIYFLVFKYIPLGGSIIAFQDYNIFSGIWESKFVGWKHFNNLFTYPEFFEVLRNTLLISLYQLIFGFPAPIILALLLNEVRKAAFKRVSQTILYLPHFMSWVIVGGLVINFLSPTVGLFNDFIEWLGMERIFFMQESAYIRSIIVASGIWRDVGWGMIIYLAAMAGINPDLYEAAEVDGAGRFRQALSVTLPSILPVVMVLLLLRIGHILDLGFEQIDVLLNPLLWERGEVFDTYIYRIGLVGGQYSYTTAIGLFKSVVGFILLIGANQISKKTTGSSIY